MASIVQTTTPTETYVDVTTSISISPSNGNRLVVCLATAGTIVSVEAGSNTLTQRNTQAYSYDGKPLYIFDSDEITGSPTSIDIELSAGYNLYRYAHEISGVDSTTPRDTTFGDQGTGITITDSFTTANASALVIGIVGNGEGLSVTPEAGYTVVGDPTSWFFGMYDADVGTAGSKTFSATKSGSQGGWAVCGIVYNNAGGTTVTGTGAVTIGATTVSTTATITRNGTAAVTVGAVTVSASGAISRSGTGAVTVAATTVQGSGAVTRTGTAAVTIGVTQVAATGAVGSIGTGHVVLAPVTVEGTGERVVTGTASIMAPAATVAASGTVTGAVSGSGNVILASVQVQGTGTRSTSATASVTIGAVTVSASGSVTPAGGGGVRATVRRFMPRYWSTRT